MKEFAGLPQNGAKVSRVSTVAALTVAGALALVAPAAAGAAPSNAPNLMGVSLGMSRAEAQKVLAANGFQADHQGDSSSGEPFIKTIKDSRHLPVIENINIEYKSGTEINKIDVSMAFRSSLSQATFRDKYFELKSLYGNPTKCMDPDEPSYIMQNKCQWVLQWQGRTETLSWTGGFLHIFLSLSAN